MNIFDQWLTVMPQLSITEPPGTLDLEVLKKKVQFNKLAHVGVECTIPMP